MSGRLNQQRQNNLEPKRMEYAIEKLIEMGYSPIKQDGKKLSFTFKGEVVTLFPYSGWHTGKTIKDGRGIEKLLNQLKQ